MIMRNTQTVESGLRNLLLELPRKHKYRYSEDAAKELVQILFVSLCASRDDWLRLMFPDGPPSYREHWRLREAQDATDGAEYTEAARGLLCGHIFKTGETTYRCRTCTDDDTCVLCSRCFEASDHEGHQVFILISSGNAGCCDCGDREAWVRFPHCAIHSAEPISMSKSEGKLKAASVLPHDLVVAIKSTIATALDYVCDVWACAPEQLRAQKTLAMVQNDERASRLSPSRYGSSDAPAKVSDVEYALVLWNDEKHSLYEAASMVARSCRTTIAYGKQMAIRINDVGRAIVAYDADLDKLLKAAKIIEEPKLSVTIRSSRDTFREEMSATIIEWIGDIAGCSVGHDSKILRSTICEEFLGEWRNGSEAHHIGVGQDGLYDHALEDVEKALREEYGALTQLNILQRLQQPWAGAAQIQTQGQNAENLENTMDLDQQDDGMTGVDAIVVDVTPDYMESPQAAASALDSLHNIRHEPSLSTSEEGDAVETSLLEVPKTPGRSSKILKSKPPSYWTEKPQGYGRFEGNLLAEDLTRRVRLDYLILYDMRMWKELRKDMRDVIISTVITCPNFKRLLGLRFSSVYTVLAELYLIADREPDHSVITLSLQMVTTPSITAEVVARGNFLTNLLAILYTFLTTRQVGYPADVDLSETLALDKGVVFNRRSAHFYADVKYLLAAQSVRDMIRVEPRYLRQFLDLAKLHQGTCATVRAVNEHVEYDLDPWVNVASATQEITKLCKPFTDSYTVRTNEDIPYLLSAIRLAAAVTIINSIGWERKRFENGEIRRIARFKEIDFDCHVLKNPRIGRKISIVDYTVKSEPMSCHHFLHYTLSWLIDRGKELPADNIRQVLLFTGEQLRDMHSGGKIIPSPSNFTPDEHLLAMLDYSIRVCAWMAQIQSGMWVRNGVSLRHQISQYKHPHRREFTYLRDLYMIQVAFVVCDPEVVLATIIDRFGVGNWVKGVFSVTESDGPDSLQAIDIAERFIQLLIRMLCDRVYLHPGSTERDVFTTTARREIIHALCFRPLSFTELKKGMTERFEDHENYVEVLEELATFKAPEGISDHGTFTLREHFLEELDPYLLSMTRNQREEAENLHKNYMAKKTGRDPAKVVFEPRIQPISSGLFENIGKFTRVPLFAQMIWYFFKYVVDIHCYAPDITSTRVEQFLQLILHLTHVAVLCDNSDENAMTDEPRPSFTENALSKISADQDLETIAHMLVWMLNLGEWKAQEAKMAAILRHMREKYPFKYEDCMANSRLHKETAEAKGIEVDEQAEKELKKKKALERQAKVMAQFKQQQDNFLQKQTIDWGSDLEDENEDEKPEVEKSWKFPSGKCILCQEETNGEKLYGSFALVTQSRIFRVTDVNPEDNAGQWVDEVLETPENLDQSADDIRPFGVAGRNKHKFKKVLADGKVGEIVRQGLSEGFPTDCTTTRPISVGCGHIMHYHCFDVYNQATRRRQAQQVARCHPENLQRNEFLCPLCKALNNTFLPIVWKPKPLSYPGILEVTHGNLDQFLHIVQPTIKNAPNVKFESRGDQARAMYVLGYVYGKSQFNGLIAANLNDVHRIPSAELREGHMPQGIMKTCLVYQRLQQSIQSERGEQDPIFPESSKPPHGVMFTSKLFDCLASSITAVEIGQRGVQCDPGTTLLNKIPAQTLTNLRVFAETVRTFLTMVAIRGNGINEEDSPEVIADLYSIQMGTLFGGLPQFKGFRYNNQGMSHLIYEPFGFLCACLVGCVDMWTVDIKSIMKICYLAEIVRVILVFARNEKLDHNKVRVSSSSKRKSWSQEQIMLITRLVEGVMSGVELELLDPITMVHLIETYSLAFLRRCTILMTVCCGIDFPSTHVSATEVPELQRLASLLCMPTPLELIREVISSPLASSQLQFWFGEKAFLQLRGQDAHGAIIADPVRLEHPAIYELIGLPRTYDTLQDEVVRRRCPTTGKDLTDPALCLICGEILCSQSVCCMRDNKGGCYQHMKKCGGNMGIFLQIRKCFILYMFNEKGSYFPAPYLDKFGETDPTLRRSLQLYLHQKRYDAVTRGAWLSHSVPSFVARRLEGDINHGGWETH